MWDLGNFSSVNSWWVTCAAWLPLEALEGLHASCHFSRVVCVSWPRANVLHCCGESYIRSVASVKNTPCTVTFFTSKTSSVTYTTDHGCCIFGTNVPAMRLPSKSLRKIDAHAAKRMISLSNNVNSAQSSVCVNESLLEQFYPPNTMILRADALPRSEEPHSSFWTDKII